MAFLGDQKPWVDASWDIKDMGISAMESEQEPDIQDEEDVKEAALGS